MVDWFDVIFISGFIFLVMLEVCFMYWFRYRYPMLPLFFNHFYEEDEIIENEETK